MRLDYFLYMAEAEGVDSWVTTNTAKINACVKDFVDYYHKGYNINDEDNQDYILRKHGLSLNSITDKECNYIMRQVERKLGVCS